MKMLTQKESKEFEIETLQIFRDFCQQNNLRYFLTFEMYWF